ncbi:hypothetical protein FK216_04765 [Moraxellaceae bacterium AER2_44_116]|nr:hypothetical protein [Moraxellaceae bacterium]TQC98839.1 hypothetical protein FK216_04765 [Moraxellaceae bacterium AER2_44_116]
MNRHDIYVWDTAQHGTPTSLEQAIDLALALEQKTEPINNKLVTFAQQVQSHLQHADAKIKYFYKDFIEEVQANDKAALIVELPEYGWQPVLRWMVDAAMGLGLAVYDHEMVLAFMPPDVVLPAKRAKEWQQLKKDIDSPRFPQTIPQFRAWFGSMFEEILAEHGFNNKGIFRKDVMLEFVRYTTDVTAGTQFIDIEYQSRYLGEFNISIMFGMSCSLVDTIYKQFQFTDNNRHTFKMEFVHGVLGLGPSKSVLQNRHQVDDMLDQIDTHLLALLDMAVDIKGINQLMNCSLDVRITRRMQGLFYRQCLIVARLANNPNFENLIVSLQPTAEHLAANPALVTEWPKLVKYLREEVKPLV